MGRWEKKYVGDGWGITRRALSLCKWATWKKNVESWIFFWWFLGVQRVRKAEDPSSRPWALFKMAIFKMAATQHYKYSSKGIKSTLCYILFVKTSLTRAGKFMVVLKTRYDIFFKMADIQNGRHSLCIWSFQNTNQALYPWYVTFSGRNQVFGCQELACDTTNSLVPTGSYQTCRTIKKFKTNVQKYIHFRRLQNSYY